MVEAVGSEKGQGQLWQASEPTPNVVSFEQAFRSIDNALRKEAGCTTELDYTEQTRGGAAVDVV